ncbi:MAG: hypothetical protein IJL38_05265 [Bacteroidales bacterium]|nr:hypothetical protein [Bacteroidales bacterium]
MKKLYFFFVILFFAAVSSYAQDTIVFRNGDEVQAKILEVSDTEMKYYLWDNLNGPVYKKNISDIFMVKYSSGYKEVYDKVKNDSYNKSYIPSLRENNVMTRNRSYLGINGKQLTDEDLRFLLTPDEYKTFMSARNQRKFGVAGFCAGLGVCVIGGVIMANNPTGGIICLIAGEIITDIGLPFVFIGNGRMNWVVRNYNARVNGETVSMTFHPSLISSPNIAGSNSYCYGLGMTLSF